MHQCYRLLFNLATIRALIRAATENNIWWTRALSNPSFIQVWYYQLQGLKNKD